MNVEELISKLQPVKPNGGGWMARCPAHKDSVPSLSVSQTDGKILLYCHAGCGTGAILEALNLQMSDLFADKVSRQGAKTQNENRKRTKPGKVVAEYVYHDESGKPVAKKVRFEPKSFAWMHLDGGEWKPGLGAVTP